MKAKNNAREQLGLTQEELAQKLGVERARVSMWESGKRDLPHDAVLILETLMTQSQKNNFYTLPGENEAIQADLIKKLHENNFQQQKITRELEKMALLYRMNSNALINARMHTQSIVNRATLGVAKNSLVQQKSLEIKLKVLKFEQSVLELELKGLEEELKQLT